MATNKNRNTVRARNVPLKTTVEDLRSIILRQFEPTEKATIIFEISLAPTCTNNGETQTAIVKFSPSMPKFLGDLSQKKVQIKLDDNEDIDIDQDFFGLTQLYPTPGIDIPLDIVAVTGLNGHAFGSWTGGKERMWLRDFLCKDTHLKACRTMIFGYNAKLKEKAVHRSQEFVLSFLEELRKARQSSKERNRPIVFLGHSFGGILIAQMLVMAKDYSDMPQYKSFGSLVKSTHALFFFGVPHRGIILDDVAKMVEEGTEPHRGSLVQEIAQLSKTVMDRFINMTMNLKIVSFYETRLTRAVAKDQDGKYGRIGDYIQVVEESSARLHLPAQIEKSFPVDGDHSTIVKFTSPADETYQTVRAELKSYIQLFRNRRGRTLVVKNTNLLFESQHEVADCFARHCAGTPDAIHQALRLAADQGLLDEMCYLLKLGANPNFQGQKHLSIGSRQSRLLMKSVPRGQISPSVDVIGEGETAVFRAAIRNNKEAVEILLRSGSDPDLSADSGKSPLHEASRRNHSAVVELLLKHGANPNVQEPQWLGTPLHDAARAGVDTVKILHRYHTDLNARLKYTLNTALHLAAYGGHESVVQFLLESNANSFVTNSKGRRPIHEAAKAGHIGVVQRLLDWSHKSEIDPRDSWGWTPLLDAAAQGHENVVWFLLRRGADRDASLRNGKRAADLAEEGGHTGVKRLLG